MAAGSGSVLTRNHQVTSDGGRIIGASRDRTKDDDPDSVEYVRRNRRSVRLSGQSRIRIRYRRFATPWFDFLRLAPEELEGLLETTGWRIRRLLEAPDSLYIIDREP
jgi:hypothetical protein